MAKTKISEYDATAGNNTDIDSINIAEGMLPSNVNNAIREMMAHLKDMDAGTQALTSPQLSSVDINGGTIDGVTIGGASAGAITGTTITANISLVGTLGTAAQGNVTSLGTLTALTVSGDIDVDGTTNLDVVDIDGAVDFASTTAHAGNATFADNVKAIFGAGSLQIYHDGSHSYISEQGTGHLKVFAEHFFVNNAGDTEQMIGATVNGAVDLFFNGSKKLATTSTGIDVTGTITSDGLTVENGTSGIAVDTSVSLSPEIKPSQALSDLTLSATGGGGHLKFKTNSNERLRIDGNTGDISFYEDTGTTAKLFWDASAESLGIGGSPSENLHVVDSAGSSAIKISSHSSGNNDAKLILDGNGTGLCKIEADKSLTFSTDGGSSEAMRITSAGDVGIGVTPTDSFNFGHALDIGSTTGGFVYIRDTDATNGIGGIGLSGNRLYVVNKAAGPITFHVNDDANERMRINSDGQIGLGTADPRHILDIEADTTGAIPTNADMGASNENDNFFSFHNASNSATFSGLALETRTSGASRWLIANEWQNTYLGDLVFRARDGGTSSSEIMRIDSSGHAIIPAGVTLGTSAGTYAAANTLDDYEEGTHDITLNQGGVGINSSYVTWRYTKIGRMVYIEGLFLASSSGDTNTVKINLPFTYLAKSGNTADQIVQTVGTYQVPTGSGGIKGTITAGTSKLEFKKTVDNGVWTALIGTDIASGDHIYVNLAYPTS